MTFLAPGFATSTEPIARRLVDSLRTAIVTLEIRPGERLSEQEIARRYGVSRQPVREAFIKLAETDLVRVLPQRGTLVVKISRRAVEDARFVREAIETAVVRAAARERREEPLAQARAIMTGMEEAMAAGDGTRFFSLDEHFHEALAAAADRAAAWRVVVEQKVQMDRVRYLDVGEATPMHTVVDQHRVILAAIEAGDVAGADRAMRDHLAVILKKLPLLEARWPELFETEAEASETF